MNLAVVNEAVTEMNGVEHQFTEEEKNFVVQFAFRSGSKEDTISLIEALAHSADKAESDEIMVTYRAIQHVFQLKILLLSVKKSKQSKEMVSIIIQSIRKYTPTISLRGRRFSRRR